LDNTTSSIAAFSVNLSYEAIPESTVAHAKQILVDSLACALGGYDCESVRIARQLAPRDPDIGAIGQIVTSDDFTTADMAAFINTAMIRSLDFNDSYPTGHPSDCIGALLAVAGAREAAGKDLLTSMVVAYEVYNRLTESAKMRSRGWDQGAAVAVAVSAGLANLNRVPRQIAEHAISLAAVSCVPLRATRAGSLSLWKGCATAEAAREATFLSSLAALGMTGPESPFEGRHGHWDLITGPFEMKPFPTEGGPYLIHGVRLKYWPVEYNTQAAVWAGIELRGKLPADQVRSIEIGTYWSAWHETGSEPAKWHPENRETADHSMPYIFARAYVDGYIDLSSFEPSAFTDSAIIQLMQLISVREDPEIEAMYPDMVAVKILVTTNSDEEIRFSIENPRGHERNQMTEQEITDKFGRFGNQLLGPYECEQALHYWTDLESQSNVRDGLALLIPNGLS
jgi:2-methylcitrate dehydratase